MNHPSLKLRADRADGLAGRVQPVAPRLAARLTRIVRGLLTALSRTVDPSGLY